MDGALTIVAAYWSPIEAHLARCRLEAEGISATLADEATAGMAWYLTGAVGGVKLLVARADAPKALAVLRAPARTVATRDGPAHEETAGDVGPQGTAREENARRALRGALVGLMLLPLQFYVTWLLCKVVRSAERLDGQGRRRATAAAAINLPVVLCMIWFGR